jgi:voltage-gated potassium channel
LLGVVTASMATWLIDRVREVDASAQNATRGDLEALHAELAALRHALSGTPDTINTTGISESN